MTFIEILFSKKFLVSFAVMALVSLILIPLPLVGTLGFEFSLVIAFVGAFISVFISAEYVNLDLGKKFTKGRRLSDVVSSVFVANFILLAFPFAVGLLSSSLNDNCYIKEGIIFYTLVPVVTVFFSSCLGLLCGSVFPRRGFLVGSLILIATVCFSLWRLYSEPPVFSYNPVFGFLPGPLYDEAIPVTHTLIIYRLIVLCWGLLFLNALWLVRGFKHQSVGALNVLTLFMLLLVLAVSHLKQEELGVVHTRDYITENFLTASFETEHFVIYYAPGTSEAGNIGLIAGDHEWRYHQLKEFLKIGSDDKIRSYIYSDVQTRKNLMGAGETTIANPIHREIHLVYSSFPHPVLKHELVHVMASEFGTKVLKISPKVGLVEGLAVAADWSGDSFTPHEWSKAMIEADSTPEIENIIGLGFWYAPASKGYTLMGSFVRYLIDSYGIEKFKTLYRTGDFSVYGKGSDKLIAEWKKFLDGVSVPPKLAALAEYRFSQPSIFQGTCPRRVADLRAKGFRAYQNENFYKAERFFSEALSFSKNDPVLIGGLAYTYYYAGDYDKLIGVIDDESGSLPQVDRNILENLRGNVLWRSGRVGRARSVFGSLLTEPVPGDVKREIEIKLSAMLSGGEVESGIQEFFGTRNRLTQATVLGGVIKNSPAYAPAYYLLGRILYNKGDYVKAVLYLVESESLGFISEDIKRENSWILGVSLFATGDYEGAIQRFKYLIATNPDKAVRDTASDFIRRCKWMQGKRLRVKN